MPWWEGKCVLRASFTSRQMTIMVAKTISRLLVQVAPESPETSNASASSAFLTEVQAVSGQRQESLKLGNRNGNRTNTGLRQEPCGGGAMQAGGFNHSPSLWQHPGRAKVGRKRQAVRL